MFWALGVACLVLALIVTATVIEELDDRSEGNS